MFFLALLPSLQVPLPESPPWWLAFNVRTEDLAEVVLTLHELYQRPRALYVEVRILVHRSFHSLFWAC